MFFVLGDSHTRELHGRRYDDPYEVERPSGTWRVLGTGGATAYGLLNESSVTGAGKRTRDYLDLFVSSDEKIVFISFGDVDAVDRPSTLVESMQRYQHFISLLSSMRGVVGVVPCMVYPRPRILTIDGRTAHEIQSTVKLWNSLLPTPVDTFSPLLGPDGFLAEEFCKSPDDPGERHLSAAGNEVVWQTIEKHCLRIRSAF